MRWPHLEMQNRVFQRRAGAVKMAVALVGRYQVGDVADDEQIVGIGLKHDRRIDSGIRTGEDRHLGLLALIHKRLVCGALILEAAIAKGLETGDELGDRIH